MRRSLMLVLTVSLAVAGCGGPAPAAPGAPVAPAALTPVTLGNRVDFGGFTSKGAPVTAYAEAGYSVAASGASWFSETGYGNLAPSLQFKTAPGQKESGQLDVTAGGATFTFSSVDLYSSTTPIPYTITGSKGGANVFTVAGTLPNTFGRFVTVANPNGGVAIDALRITLTNTPAPCCANPMGVDNLIFGQ